jgi:hypothetical protein
MDLEIKKYFMDTTYKELIAELRELRNLYAKMSWSERLSETGRVLMLKIKIINKELSSFKPQ